MRHLLALLFVAVAICAAPNAIEAQTSDADIDRAIEGNTALAAVMRAEPGRQAQILADLRRAWASGAETLEQEVFRLSRQHTKEMVPGLIAYAPDADVLALLDANLVALDEASAQGGGRCHAFLVGDLDGAPMPEFTASTTRGLNESLARIVVAGAGRHHQRLLDDEESMPILEAVVTRTYEIAGDNPVDFEAVAYLLTIEDDDTKAAACATTIYLYRAILEMPRSDAAVLFRTLIATS